MYLGDFAEDATVYFLWSTNDGDGASITRSVDGTISVYKDNSTTQTTQGITDTEDFDGLTGIHLCTIDTSADAFYATGHDYHVVLSGSTIDGQSVNAILRQFSIENRFDEVDVTKLGGAGQSATDLKDFADAGYDPSTNKVQGVVLVDTVTTVTGHTAQTGDSFARLGAPAGVSVSADILAIDNFVDDLESRLTAIRAGYLDNLNIGENVAGTSEISGLNDPSASAIALAVGQRQIPDSYAADGAQPTIEQALLAVLQFLQERAVSGTTVTVRKPDGTTEAMTFTLDDGTNPTSITRSS